MTLLKLVQLRLYPLHPRRCPPRCLEASAPDTKEVIPSAPAEFGRCNSGCFDMRPNCSLNLAAFTKLRVSA
jgi:hypothetical protein